MDASLKSVFFACQAAARVMIPNGGGKIINIGSTFGVVALGNAYGSFSAPAYTGTDISLATVATGNYSDGAVTRTIPAGAIAELASGVKITLVPIEGDAAAAARDQMPGGDAPARHADIHRGVARLRIGQAHIAQDQVELHGGLRQHHQPGPKRSI